MKNFFKKTVALALVCAFTAAGTNINNVSATTGEYKSWKQGDSRWGSIYLGSSGQSLSRIGCAVTSVAILMVHSGSMSDESFNPGKLCNYLSANGGFDGYGNIRWGVASGMAPSFTYQGGGTISGSKSAKASQISSYLKSGYYAIVSVKYGGHWVAIDHVDEDGTVYMIDPAKGTNTNLFSVYDAAGVGQIRLFKGANSKNNAQIQQKPAETTEKEPAVTTTPSKKEETVTTTAPKKENTVVTTTTPEVVETTGEFKEGRYTSTDVLNIRKSASVESSRLGKLPVNESVFVYQVEDNWGKISYNGVEGWVCLDYTTYGGVTPSFAEGLYSTVADLNLRASADITSKSKLVIPVSKTVAVTETKENWGKVEYNGSTGWICLDYTSYDGVLPVEEEEIDERAGEYLTFDEVNLRKEATSLSESLVKVPGYAHLEVTETDGDWGKVEYKGKTGWICLDYAKLLNHTVKTGDINGDGYITINDASLLRQEIAGKRTFTAAEIKISDMNGDGKVDNTDVALIEKKLG